jgi:hypothetical protein
MQRAPCQKCGSSDVHYGTPWEHPGRLVTKVLSYPGQKLTYYICCSCGNVEITLESEFGRQMIAREWPKIETG